VLESDNHCVVVEHGDWLVRFCHLYDMIHLCLCLCILCFVYILHMRCVIITLWGGPGGIEA